MPGLRKELNTSDWTASHWRLARTINLAFLVGWLAFFGLAIRVNLNPINWFMLVTLLLIGVVGVAIQIVWLVRISIWLDKQKNTKSAP